MNLDNIAAVLYFTAIPVFIIGLITLIVQFIRKKKKKVPIIMIFVSILLVVGCLGVPLLDDQEEIDAYVSYLSEQNKKEYISEERISKEVVEKIAKQEIVNLCCENSYVSSIKIDYGTFDISEYKLNSYKVEALGTYVPVDDYGMYQSRKKFYIRLSVNDEGKTTVLAEDYSSAY